MAITLQQSGTGEGHSAIFGPADTTVTVTLAGAPSANHLLVAFVCTDSFDVDISAAFGWTKLTEEFTAGSGENIRSCLLYKIANGSETSTVTIATLSDVGSWNVALLEYSGVSTSGPLDVENATTSATATKTSPSVTPTASVERLVVGAAATYFTGANSWSGETVAGSTTGVTERIDYSGAGFQANSIAVWDKDVASTSGSYTAAGTASIGAQVGAAHIAIFAASASGASTPATPAAPTMTIEVAFATNPGAATQTWTDISAYVYGFQVSRGRSKELDRDEAGTASLTLNNNDRRFDPTYTAGPYYPNVLPMRRVRITATWSSTAYVIFQGFIESWGLSWVGKNIGTVTIPATDGFKALSLKTLNTSFASERTDARITNVLDAVGWSTVDRDLTTGISNLASGTLANVNALQYLQTVIQSENGRGYISATGAFIFKDRHQPFNSTISNATFGDSTAELRYADLKVEYNDDLIFNEIRVTREDGTEQVQTDTATSQLKYLPRTLVRSGLLVDSDNECNAAATYLLTNYKDPSLRITEIEIIPADDAANLFPQVLARDLGNRVTIIRRPPGGGNTITQQSFLEGISHTYSINPAQLWKTVWRLSPIGVGYAVGTPIRLDTNSGQIETSNSGTLVY